jgi:hypothetical protein
MVNKIIREIIQMYPDIDRTLGLTDAEIERTEERLKIRLPESYKTFVKEYSNGICLLDTEPIAGIGEPILYTTNRSREPFPGLEPPCGVINFASEILGDTENIVKIIPTTEVNNTNRLLSFTMGDTYEASNSHWVFICDSMYPNNEYRVGFISQITGNIVAVLDNFERWLSIFWENEKKHKETKPVFHIIYPRWEKRARLLDK